MTISADTLHLISKDIAQQYRIIPTGGNAEEVSLYYDIEVEVDNLSNELEIILDKKVNLIPLEKAEIDRLLATHYLNDAYQNDKTAVKYAFANDNFLKVIIDEAKNLKSSDIHIETFEKKSRVRIRIDGMMIERYQINKEDYPAIVNKIKIMANLDIAEKRLPQDGRIQYKASELESFDIRVSILPTLHGEKVVLRLLSNNSTDVDLNKLGLSTEDLENYMQGIQRPNGIILISGPTGSGKTTTLYATLKLLNKTTRNILTIEDPIEYTLEGINQVQLKESIGLGFAAALRTFLRQDPDVIMVGEIRDAETANMAIRAALTGHLVLSTIHTNSAWGTVSRLIDMGIPNFLVANTLNTSVAQRLVRLLCENCKEEQPFNQTQYPKQFKAPLLLTKHFVAKGCKNCFYTGYKGREAVYEVIPLDTELAFEIKQGNWSIEHLLKTRNIKTISENAFILFSSGKTSLEEIFPLLLSI